MTFNGVLVLTRRLTTQEFIEKAIKVHGNLYDYSLIDYKNSHTNVTIICNKHGVFEQRPANHVSSARGCPTCANIKTTSHTRNSIDHYLPSLINTHADKYDYSEFEYVNSKTKSKVKCNCGNIFNIDIEHLLRGQGCPCCAKSGFKPDKPCFFYVVKLNEDIIKCGISIDVKDRFCRLKRSCTSEYFEPLYCIRFENSVLAKNLEDFVKVNFRRSEVNRELISDGFTETYYTEDIGDILSAVCKYSTQNCGKFLSFEEYKPT